MRQDDVDFAEQLVGAGKIVCQRVQNALDHGHHQRGGRTVPGNIGHDDPESSVTEMKIIVIIATHLIGGVEVAGDIQRFSIDRFGRQQAVLNISRHCQFLLHALFGDGFFLQLRIADELSGLCGNNGKQAQIAVVERVKVFYW